MIHLLPEFVLAEGVRYGSATVAVPTDRDAVQQELEKITGSWVLVYWLFDGKEQSLAEGRPVMTFEAERFTIRRGGGSSRRATSRCWPRSGGRSRTSTRRPRSTESRER